MKRIVAVGVGAGLLLTGCGDGGGGGDPYRNAVSDERAPEVTVTQRDEAGEPMVDLDYDPAGGRVPLRATYAFLQTLDGQTWSTAYTLSRHLDDGYDEGVPVDFYDDANGGSGPDTYRVPDLDPDDTYRICVEFVIRGHSANGCSAPFHSS